MTTLSSPYLLAVFSIFFSVVTLIRGDYDPPPGSVLYVDANTARGGTGASWETPITNLQDALLRAEHDRRVREIRLATGTYAPGRRNDNQSANTFEITVPNLTISGGYRGGGQGGNERDPIRFPTRLTQRMAGAPILSVRYNAGHTRLDGLIIGNLPDSPTRTDIGLDVYHSRISVIDCLFEGIRGRSDRYFAGVRLEGSQPASFTDCRFVNNSGSKGGGVLAIAGAADFNNCLFADNSADRTGGGTQLLYHGVYTFNYCTFINNRSRGSGGAIAQTPHATTRVSLNHCLLQDNSDAAGFSVHSGRTNVSLQSTLFDPNPVEAQRLKIINGVSAHTEAAARYISKESDLADDRQPRYGLR
ncbi:right-handed parallel beta-helix repeat-containing protein [Lewinella sp. JB7]|uniref:right-handed parallel beta-helix repeat-containing protein n=1 Tax=Lewinella sp. JB7 TaxID=2962887 RepID=UPI0020CA191E|nr:right-handed parallel beta-helix repeat-containing protein [Lewinella sp. JB7]MCP9236369.1 right-handed parallel beta-helix repeat-containing protein [Lewinella sp. JB7]